MNVIHNSGKWDAPLKAFMSNVRRLRKETDLITRTEMTTDGKDKALRTEPTEWSVWHPQKHDCSIEWKRSVWAVEHPGKSRPLSKIRVHTKSGFLRPPCTLEYVVLRNRLSDRVVLFGVTHMDLANTPLRVLSWLQSGRNLNKFVKAIHKEHPKWEVVINMDCNRNQKLAVNRALLRRVIQSGTRLKNLWVGVIPPKGGTHGRSLLDVTLSTLNGESFLIDDDNSSDHRPFKSMMHL
jgi:hypothetical protein